MVPLRLQICCSHENISNKELAKKSHKPIISNPKKRKKYSSFLDNIWSAGLAHLQLVSKFNKGTHFLSLVIYIFSKCAWIIPLKDKKGIIITNASQKILDEYNHKPYWQIIAASFMIDYCNHDWKK